MTIWLLFTGTEYEDYGVSDAYATEASAIQGAKDRMANDHEPEYGEWEQQPLLKELAGVRCAKHMWFRGHDRLWITPYEVKP